jgi:inner membrane transporter RhtA
MVLGSILSVQCGSALATTLFDEVGPGGAVFLRTAFGALVLLGLAGRSVRAPRGPERRDVVLFGMALAGMNLSFYAALDRLPLGVAVTLEFVGPLAAAGIALLSDGLGGAGVDATGALLALLAGGFWAAYILLSARVGNSYPGLGGLAMAMAISAVLVAPFGIAQGEGELLTPSVLAVGLAVGIFSSAIPYALELEALRRLPNAVFGVLMSLEPGVAAVVGFVALSQAVSPVEAVAIGLVVAASAGALRSAATPAPRDG